MGRPRRRWEANIRMDLEEIGVNAGNRVDSVRDRNYWGALVNVALNLRVPYAIEFLIIPHDFKFYRSQILVGNSAPPGIEPAVQSSTLYTQ